MAKRNFSILIWCGFWALNFLGLIPNILVAQPILIRTDYDVVVRPYMVAVGDLDGDGNLDLAVPNNGRGENSISVLIGNGNGTFQPAVNIWIGGDSQHIDIGDYNKDGNLDLAVIGERINNSIAVLLGKGDGTFFSPAYFGSRCAGHCLASGDFDNDGDLDLAACLGGLGPGGVSIAVLLGNGNGTFMPEVFYAAGLYPEHISIGDLDKDGDLDLVIGENSYFSVIMGKGDGSFLPTVNYPTYNQCGVDLGDFDKDGDLDLAASNLWNNSITIFQNNGAGTFQRTTDYPTGPMPFSVCHGDFDGDGNLDLATGAWGGNLLSVLLGNGDGSFNPVINYPACSGPQRAAPGDFDGDGDLDLAVANYWAYNISVFINDTIPPNLPPLASAGPDMTLAIGQTGTFDGTGSSDPDGTIVDYHWDFGDNTSASGMSVNHAYTAKGTYYGALTVTDDQGAMARDYFTVTVSNSPPVAEAGPDMPAAVGQTVQFDGSQSIDSDGTIVRYLWNFGDGGTAEGPTPTHIYNEKVVWPVTLTVTDNEGATALDTLMVTVINTPPIAEAGDSKSLKVFESATFNAGGSSDPDGMITGYSWDFGDGATATGVTATHAYSRKGPFTVTLTVNDDDGAAASDTLVVTVINSPPLANAGPDQTIEGTGPATSFTLNGSLSSDPDGDLISFKWQDSNGNVVSTAPSLSLSRALGSFAFTLTVTDTDNATSSDSVSVTIRDTTPPTITAPANIVIDMSDPYGTLVNLGLPTVTDICDPNPTIHVSFSGLFQVGETTVTWTATDHSGNVATAQQTITVEWGSPSNQLVNLTKLIQYSVAAGKINPELETSLLAKVAAAMDAIARANENYAKTAMNDLKALVNQVEAQQDKKITPDIAAEIIAWANHVITDLGG